LPATTEPSNPALAAIWRSGGWSARRTTSTPTRWSSLPGLSASSTLAVRTSATPPPGI